MKNLSLYRLHVTVICSLLFLLVASCIQRKGWALHSIENQTVIFYVEHIGGSADTNIRHKNLTYKFGKDHTYKSYFGDGTLFETGDYSYQKIEPNKCRVVMSYRMYSKTYLYEFVMTYTHPNTGSWQANLSNNPEDKGSEYGSFKHLYQN